LFLRPATYERRGERSPVLSQYCIRREAALRIIMPTIHIVIVSKVPGDVCREALLSHFLMRELRLTLRLRDFRTLLPIVRLRLVPVLHLYVCAASWKQISWLLRLLFTAVCTAINMQFNQKEALQTSSVPFKNTSVCFCRLLTDYVSECTNTVFVITPI
jgi:hypothetical protein